MQFHIKCDSKFSTCSHTCTCTNMYMLVSLNVLCTCTGVHVSERHWKILEFPFHFLNCELMQTEDKVVKDFLNSLCAFFKAYNQHESTNTTSLVSTLIYMYI